MKLKTAFCSFAVAALIAGGLTACRTSHEKLVARAKIPRADAEKTALAKVPGVIMNGELEVEKGVLMWSFDVIANGERDPTEVEVDAKTGQILGVDKKTVEKAGKPKQ